MGMAAGPPAVYQSGIFNYYHIFSAQGPRSVWTWLLALYFIPVFGIVFYLLFGQDMKKSRMFRVKEVSDRLNLPVKSQEDIIRSDDMPEEMMDPCPEI